tara:strand:+ start:5731 stop:6033 length:303 start_codon:yes stop_codon:yes gene_type:complete
MTDDLLYRLRGVMCGDDPVIEEAASRIEELEKYQSIHSQCDKSSLEVEGKLVQRLSLAHARIEKLEAALRELSTDWDCCAVSKNMKLIARKALEGKDESN